MSTIPIRILGLDLLNKVFFFADQIFKGQATLKSPINTTKKGSNMNEMRSRIVQLTYKKGILQLCLNCSEIPNS